MNKFTIQTTEVYLTDVKELNKTLPNNCIFSKGATGAGGTTLGLLEDRNTLIVVPYTSMIKNKMYQIRDNSCNMYKYPTLGVSGDVKVSDITEFINSNEGEYKKIIGTYDSLSKILEVINPKEWHILIDEYHLLLKAYSFRHEAVSGVLKNYKKFNSYTFMSATPIDEDFILEELKKVPVFEINWLNSKEVVVEGIHCERIEATTINIVKSYLNGDPASKDKNLHIFCNSTKFMNRLVSACKLDDNNTRAVYSKFQGNRVQGVTNKETSDPVKKINMYTSCVFEGSDIYDENGVTLVVSDYKKQHMLLDVSSDIPQIAGRIRNSKYNNHITHLYSVPNRFKGLTYAEYSKMVKENIERERLIVEGFNKMGKHASTDAMVRASSYISFNNNPSKKEPYVIDTNRQRLEMYLFKLTNGIYRSKFNLVEAYRKAGLGIKFKDGIKRDDKPIPKRLVEAEQGFQGKLSSYNQLETQEEKDFFVSDLKKSYPWMEKAVEELGMEEIIRLKGNQTNIERAVSLKQKLSQLSSHFDQVEYLLGSTGKIKVGGFVSSKYLKAMFGNIYRELDIKKTPKGSDITEFYNCKSDSKYSKERGVMENGYYILGKKYKK